MNAVQNSGSILKVVGSVEHLDTLTRHLRLAVENHVIDFVVPPDCFIFLNGERVKLRLLQPRDQVEVAFSLIGGLAVAHSVRGTKTGAALSSHAR